VTLRARHRTRPIRVVLDVADHALRADIADACEDAGIAVATPPPYPPPLAGEGREGEDADVVLADRPVETDVPMIFLASGKSREGWPTEVRAVVSTDVDAATLTAIIIVVANGYTLVPRKDVAREDTGAWAGTGVEADELPVALSPREREVLALLSEGASNKEIARTLAVSVHTAKFHVASLTEKLGARSRVEAIAIAIRAGLVMV
jgi:DNA-binding CsgD family transcriptional regulator